MKLAAQLKIAEHADFTEAYRDYRGLIERAGKSNTEDVERMREIMELLSLTREDVEGDIRALETFPGLRKRAATIDQFEKELAKAQKAVQAKKDELKKVTAEIESEWREWRHEASAAGRQLEAARNAAEQIERLTSRHWRLSGAPAPRPEPIGGRWNEKEVEALLASEPPRVDFPHGESDATAPIHRLLVAGGYFKSTSKDTWRRAGVPDEPALAVSPPSTAPAEKDPVAEKAAAEAQFTARTTAALPDKVPADPAPV